MYICDSLWGPVYTEGRLYTTTDAPLLECNGSTSGAHGFASRQSKMNSLVTCNLSFADTTGTGTGTMACCYFQRRAI